MRQWWNNRTIDAFKEQAKCFEEQYSQYAVDSEHVSSARYDISVSALRHL